MLCTGVIGGQASYHMIWLISVHVVLLICLPLRRISMCNRLDFGGGNERGQLRSAHSSCCCRVDALQHSVVAVTFLSLADDFSGLVHCSI